MKGQVALVTGALGDIGRAISLCFAEKGVRLALCDLAETDSGFSASLGSPATYDRVDVSREQDVSEWLELIAKRMGHPSIAIINAAKVTPAPILQVSSEDWEDQLRVNLTGAFLVAQAAARGMIEAGHAGRIVFIGSWAAHAPDVNIPAYCVSKAGLRMLMKCMAKDLACFSIQVNEVAPGYVDAGLSARMFESQPGLRADCERRVPLRRLISAEEVAEHVLWLCSPLNRNMTGSSLLMDGGLSL